MQLRQKFGCLALIYVLSLTANLVMSGWCIVVYFQSALETFRSESAREQEIEHIRDLVRQQRALFQKERPPAELAGDWEDLEGRISRALAQFEQDEGNTKPVAHLWPAIMEAAARKQRAISERPEGGDNPAASHVMTDELRGAFTELVDLLGEAGAVFHSERRDSVARATDTQQRVVTILMANAACGAFLCGLGLIFVRRWVIHPVADLREATKQIAGGDFSYRITPRSADELGQLAGEVNQMASTIDAMQSKLIEQERLAAAGEMVARLAHNIRNPLAGIRGLAEATAGRCAADAETAHCQQRIIDTVDRFEKWLRDLQGSVSPMTLNPQPVPIAELIEQVVTALQPMLDRRQVAVQTQVDPGLQNVQVDRLHFEQAVVALVTNAVQASAAGQSVRARVAPADKPGQWQLSVEDDGPGVPREIRDKIFMPYFTTKPGGNGVGLAIASKVVKLHGGKLTVESEVGHGSRFVATMPGLVPEG